MLEVIADVLHGEMEKSYARSEQNVDARDWNANGPAVDITKCSWGSLSSLQLQFPMEDAVPEHGLLHGCNIYLDTAPACVVGRSAG